MTTTSPFSFVSLQSFLLKSDFDALLFIGGIDSRDDPLSKSVLKRLGVDVEDGFVVVHRCGVEVYSPDKATISSPCGTVRLWNAEPQSSSIDDREEAKVRSLVSCLQATHPATSQATTRRTVVGVTAAPMVAERWPLVMGLALEGLLGGFFSLVFDVRDGSQLVNAWLGVGDEAGVGAVLDDALQVFSYHWLSTLANLEDLPKSAAIEGVGRTAAAVGEPLHSYFHYQADRAEGRLAWKLPPRLAFGGADAGPDRRLAKEDVIVVVEGSQPNGPLYAARTLVVEQQHQHDVAAAVGAVVNVAAALWAVAAAVGEDLRDHRDPASRRGVEALEALARSHLPSTTTTRCSLRVVSTDNLNGPCSLWAPGSPRAETGFHSFRLAVAVENVGEVVHGDTYSFRVVGPCLAALCLTESLPLSRLLRACPARAAAELALQAISTADKKRVVKGPLGAELGEMLAMPLEHFPLLLPTKAFPAVPGLLRAFAHGLAFTDPHAGVSVVPLSAVASVAVFLGDDAESPGLVVLHLKPQQEAVSIAPGFASLPSVALGLRAGGGGGRVVRRDILPVWREWCAAKEVPVVSLDQVPPEYLEAYGVLVTEKTDPLSLLTRRLFSAAMISPGLEHTHKSASTLKPSSAPAAKAFLAACQAVDAQHGRDTTESLAKALLDLEQDEEEEEGAGEAEREEEDGLEQDLDDDHEDGAPVTVLVGGPGPAKELLVDLMLRSAGDDTVWAVCPPAPATGGRSAVFSWYSDEALRAVRERRAGRRLRVMVVAGAYEHPADVCSAIMAVPGKRLRVAAVICAISADTLFLPGRISQPDPAALTLCSPGWVTATVVVGNNSKTAGIAKWVEAVNPSANLLPAGRIEADPESTDGAARLVVPAATLEGLLARRGFDRRPLPLQRELYAPARHLAAARPRQVRAVRVTVPEPRPAQDALLLSLLPPAEREPGHSEPSAAQAAALALVLPGGLHAFPGNPKPLILRPAVPQLLTSSLLYVVGPGPAQVDVKVLAIPTPKPLLAREALTAETLRTISKDNALVTPSKPGIMFDGRRWLDLEGNRWDLHPDIEALAEKWLQERNKAIQQENEALPKTAAPTLQDA